MNIKGFFRPILSNQRGNVMNFRLQLVSFKKFKDTAEAVENATRLAEGKLTKALKKTLKGKLQKGEELAVGEVKLGNIIKVRFFSSFHLVFLKIKSIQLNNKCLKFVLL